MKLPYLKFYPGDWLKDPDLGFCNSATRGVWIDLLCAMHERDQSGELCGTLEQLARTARCSTVELTHALTDLQNNRAADVTVRNENITIVCRRMKRENDARENNAERQRRHREITQSNREQTPVHVLVHDSVHEAESEQESLRRVREFARGEGICESDADWFFWKGQGNGWTNGGKPIKDWKATLRSWNRAGYLPSQRNSRNGREDVFRPRPKEPAPRGQAYRPYSPPTPYA